MTDEARKCVEALRTSCEENGSCPDCPIYYWCYAKNGVRLEDTAADLIERLSAMLDLEVADNNKLREELKQAKRERDAAIEDIKESAAGGICFLCKKFHAPIPNERRAYCELTGPRPDFEGALRCYNFEWRGPREAENGKS